MLQKVTHIEGLESYENQELFDDTPPGTVLTKFEVIAEDMPFLTSQAKRRVTKNFVHVQRTWELGRSSYRRRIRDEVVFDENTNKWKVVQLAPGDQSDIRKNTSEWNAFATGSSDQTIGTPLSVLFPNDPSKVEHYKYYHIISIENLAGQNETNITNMGPGGRADVEKAKVFISRTAAEAPMVHVEAEMRKKDEAIQSLQSTVQDLTAKLTELLSEKIESGETPRKRGRPAKEEGANI